MYTNYNDYELIYLIRDNNPNAFDLLFSKYDVLIKLIVNEMYQRDERSYDLSNYSDIYNIDNYDYIYQVDAFTNKINILSSSANSLYNERRSLSSGRQIFFMELSTTKSCKIVQFVV